MDQPGKGRNHNDSAFEAADCTAVCLSINRDLGMIGLSARSMQAKPEIAVKSSLILLHAQYQDAIANGLR